MGFGNWRPGAVCLDITGSQAEPGSDILHLPGFQGGNPGPLWFICSALWTARIKYPLKLSEELYRRSSRVERSSHTYLSRCGSPQRAALWGATADAEDPTHTHFGAFTWNLFGLWTEHPSVVHAHAECTSVLSFVWFEAKSKPGNQRAGCWGPTGDNGLQKHSAGAHQNPRAETPGLAVSLFVQFS